MRVADKSPLRRIK